MKVGGGLNYVEGPMGAGKTLYGVRRIVDTVVRGGYVITNVELRPGWNERVARRVNRTASKAKRAKIAAKLEALYVYETDLQLAMKYRVPGAGEARATFVWDEGHNDLNNRRWKDDGRAQVLEWATQLRKLGFVGYLLSQHADNTDAALRRICNFRVRLQNQREQTRMLGVRVSPWPLFLACWYPTNTPIAGKTKPVKVERYFLGWHRHLYDTFGLFHGLTSAEVTAGLVLLPDLSRKSTLTPGARPLELVAQAMLDAAPVPSTPLGPDTPPALWLPATPWPDDSSTTETAALEGTAAPAGIGNATLDDQADGRAA